MSNSVIVTEMCFDIPNAFAARAAAAALREAGYDADMMLRKAGGTENVVNVVDVPAHDVAAVFDVVGAHAADAQCLHSRSHYLALPRPSA